MKSKERYHTLFRYLPDGIILMDSMGNILEANNAACDILGYLSKDLTGMNISALFMEKDVSKVMKGLTKKIGSGEYTTAVFEGEARRYDFAFSRSDDEGKGLGIVQVFRYPEVHHDILKYRDGCTIKVDSNLRLDESCQSIEPVLGDLLLPLVPMAKVARFLLVDNRLGRARAYSLGVNFSGKKVEEALLYTEFDTFVRDK